MVIADRGLVSIDPPFPGLFSEKHPGRHNNLIWPFLNGMFIQAAAKCANLQIAEKELMNLTRLVADSNYHFWEVYSPCNGKPFGGWQLDKLWDSYPEQTWSAACYIGAILQGILGIDIREDGVHFIPCVPEKMQNATLRGLTVRNMDITLTVHGWGTKIQTFLLDGIASDPVLMFDDKPHHIEITLT